MHRLCKAFLLGMEEIEAVQLSTMPPYLWRLLPGGEEVKKHRFTLRASLSD